MSLPGLQLNTTPVEQRRTSSIHELRRDTEWRFEVEFGHNVELLSGTAEIFGTELALNQVYAFNGRKAAAYTWHGCRIEVTGECQVDYIAEETPMTSYANLHFALEDQRQSASESGRLGPRILIVGPDNAGKTSLMKTLSAYATRSGRQPVLVNLDSKEGMLSIPGTLSAIALESIIDVEQGWGNSPTNGPSHIPVKLPLVYFYGIEDPETNTKIFTPIVSRLALSVMSRMQDDYESKATGCIVDTPGIFSQGKGGYELIQHTVAEFQIDVLLVLGSERLYSDMARRFSNRSTNTEDSISVIKLEKSGGCVDRDISYLTQYRQAQIREYFFGDIRNTLSPHTQQLDFGTVVIYKAAEDSALLNSLLPGGEPEIAAEAPLFDKVQPSSLMQNSILAIVQADPHDSVENIRDASVIGFLYIAEVDEKKKKLRVLAPLSGRLPNKAMIWGSWPDSVDNLVG
ncbi:Cleavage polyadenylation factor subunit clp1 [Lignoscripta atroalba]|nr:Cleavage polyadenylation factor subunit clp1 [Lignoscripta atroalba]